MKGRRLADSPAGRIPPGCEPGDCWKVLSSDGTRPVTPEEWGGAGHDYSGNLTGGVWYVMTPNGLLGGLCLHTVREEDDGTISIRPGDGSSNSVLIEGYSPTLKSKTSWHGYIEHNEWTAC